MDKKKIIETFRNGPLRKIVDILWEIHDGRLNSLSNEEIEFFFKNFNYSIIPQKDIYQIEELLDILGFLGHKYDDIYKNIVLKVLENKKRIKDLINYLINEDRLYILNKEELESLDLKEISFSEEDSGEIEELPEELGDIIALEKIILYYGNRITRLPDSIGNLANLKVLELRDANRLKSLPNSILKLKNLKSIILPSYTEVFEVPEWTFELNWLEELNFEVNVLETRFTFNLIEYIDVLNKSELKLFSEAIMSLGKQRLKDFSFPDDIFNIFIKKLAIVKNKGDKKKIRKKLIEHIEIYYKIIWELSDRGYIWEKKYIDEFCKKIGTSLSPVFKKIIREAIKSNDHSKIADIYFKKWLYLVNEVDLMELLEDTQLELLDKLKKVVKDMDWCFDFSEEVDAIFFIKKYKINILPSTEFKLLGINFKINEHISFIIKGNNTHMYLYGTPIEELDEVLLDFIDVIKQNEVSIKLFLNLLIFVDNLDYLREDLFFTLIDLMEETDIMRENYSDLLKIIDKLQEDSQCELYMRIFNVIKGTEVMEEIIPDLLNLLDNAQANFHYKSFISIINMMIRNEILNTNYSFIDTKLKNLLKMLYSSKLGINKIKDAFFGLIDVIKGTKLIKDNFLELLNIFDSFDYETPRDILINALQGGKKEFKEMITEAFKTKNYLWIDTIILTPEFLDYITIDIVKNPSIDFFKTIFETVQFIRQEDSYNMQEYLVILTEFLENMKEKEIISEEEFEELLKKSAIKHLK